MFQFQKQQLQTLQQHANQVLRDKFVKALNEQGLKAAVEPKSGDVVWQDALGARTRMGLTESFKPKFIERPSKLRTEYHYDEQERLISVTTPSGARQNCQRNAMGQITSMNMEGQSPFKLAYGSDHRLHEVEYPDGRKIQFQHNPVGEVTQITDRAGQTIKYHKHRDGESIEDPLGRVTKYQTDPFGHIQGLTFPDGSREEYEADVENKLIYVQQRDSSTFSVELNDAGSPIGIQWDDGRALALAFDDQDRLTTAANDAIEIGRAYDKAGRLISEGSIAGPIVHAYDANGRVSSTTTPFGDEVKFQYDADGRLAAILDWDGRRISLVYEGEFPSRIDYPNGVIERIGLKAAPYRASSILSRDDFHLSTHAIEADQCERAQNIKDEWLDSTGVRRQLQYDAEDRLIGELCVDTGRSLQQFAYDAVGNMVDDNGHRVAFGPMNEPTVRDGQSLVYDGLGNLTSVPTKRGPMRLEYSADSRLRKLHDNELVWQYEYDACCRRISKTDGTRRWSYGWSGSQLLWEEYVAHPDAEPVRRDYLYMPQGATPIAFRESGKTYWMQSDFRGAVIAVHDESGQLVWRGIYESFGHCTTPIEEVRQPWRLAGQYLDEESGLHYNLARYYSPELKSYLSLDGRWQEPEATNYSYARNDPWNRADPLGTLAPLVVGAIGVGLAGVIGGAVNAYNAPPGERLSAFGKGFAVGAGSALVGIAAAMALPSIGVAATAVAGLAIIGAVEGAASSVLEDMVNGRPICIKCALLSAGLGAVLGVALPAVGGFLARKLLPKLKPLLNKLKSLRTKKPPGAWKGPANYKTIVDKHAKRRRPGKDFTKKQKEAILAENKRHNGGVLRSDLDGTILDPPVQAKKGVPANPKQAEVDHVYPKSEGGYNSYDNAQVLSKQQNMKKSNKL